MSDLLAERLAHGGVLVIKDSLAVSGMFLIAMLLRKTLQDGNRAVLVLVDHTFSHYQQMLRKLGCNLVACRDSGQLLAVDVLAAQLDWDAPDALQKLHACISGAVLTSQGAACVSRGASNQAPHDGDISTSSVGQLCPSPGPCTVFCDGLSTIAALVDETGGSFSAAAPGYRSCTLGGGFDSQWTAFCHHLVLMAQDPGPGFAPALVALVHSDVDADERWLRALDFASDTIVAVHALESGHSADVSGEMTVLRRSEPVLSGEALQHAGGSIHRRESAASFYFRAADNAVTFVRKQE